MLGMIRLRRVGDMEEIRADDGEIVYLPWREDSVVCAGRIWVEPARCETDVACGGFGEGSIYQSSIEWYAILPNKAATSWEQSAEVALSARDSS